MSPIWKHPSDDIQWILSSGYFPVFQRVSLSEWSSIRSPLVIHQVLNWTRNQRCLSTECRYQLKRMCTSPASISWTLLIEWGFSSCNRMVSSWNFQRRLIKQSLYYHNLRFCCAFVALVIIVFGMHLPSGHVHSYSGANDLFKLKVSI